MSHVVQYFCRMDEQELVIQPETLPSSPVHDGVQVVPIKYNAVDLMDAGWVRSQLIIKATEAKLKALDRIIAIIPKCTRVGELAAATKIMNELSTLSLDDESKENSLLTIIRQNMIENNADDVDFEMIADTNGVHSEMASASNTYVLNALRDAVKSRGLKGNAFAIINPISDETGTSNTPTHTHNE